MYKNPDAMRVYVIRVVMLQESPKKNSFWNESRSKIELTSFREVKEEEDYKRSAILGPKSKSDLFLTSFVYSRLTIDSFLSWNDRANQENSDQISI